MKNVKRRAILTVVALALLLGVVVYMTYAWYTRLTGVSQTEFHLARWDFNANYQTDDFKVNVYEYASVDGHNIAAPGTSGTLDVHLGAQESDTDVKCIVQLDHTTMSPEFIDRIYFYQDKEMTKPMKMDETFVEVLVPAHGEQDGTVYWHWIYDYDEYLEMHDSDRYFSDVRILRTVYDSRLGSAFSLDTLYMLAKFKRTASVSSLRESWQSWSEASSEEKRAVHAYLNSLPGSARSLLLNYEEVLDTFTSQAILEELNEVRSSGNQVSSLDAFLQETVNKTHGDLDKTVTEYFTQFLSEEATPVTLGLDTYFGGYLTEYEEFDDFDTRVGANPEVFKHYMEATLYVTGTQVEPETTS